MRDRVGASSRLSSGLFYPLIIINFDLNCKKFFFFFVFKPPSRNFNKPFKRQKSFYVESGREPLCTGRCSFGRIYVRMWLVDSHGKFVRTSLCGYATERDQAGRICSSLRRTASPRPLGTFREPLCSHSLSLSKWLKLDASGTGWWNDRMSWSNCSRLFSIDDHPKRAGKKQAPNSII